MHKVLYFINDSMESTKVLHFSNENNMSPQKNIGSTIIGTPG